ncbi:class I SAM-dependent methyltransferase [Amycolatopsis sp. WAC 01416]|uniref:class I SAM-dependent methyltransferase n=1 Tax=Amycolatopsis sp. WAC 01416 TaxID=2203196 RepID=UPI000F766A9C|nr:class I SAM-dependent methyltransferase [Amycolatopsis sp. WAC 01416]RSN35524.1 class I SAM-dependent methyltransferase [Amycolatopsis sp. WAC 01416]
MEKVRFTEEKATMLATLYGRALDARSDRPILGDKAADEAVKQIDYDFGSLGVTADMGLTVALRAKPMDDWTSEFLKEHPDATVVQLGCGMDSRVYRVDPPPSVRWFDVDYPEVVDLRARIYPERDGYRTIGSSVTDFAWIDEIPSDKPGLVIAEGLTMYLRPSEGEELLRRLIAHFPQGGEMVFDTFSRLGIKLQKLNPVVRKAKATLYWGIDEISELERLGLTLVSGLDSTDYATPEVKERISTSMRAQLWVAGLFPAFKKMGRILRFRF